MAKFAFGLFFLLLMVTMFPETGKILVAVIIIGGISWLLHERQR